MFAEEIRRRYRDQLAGLSRAGHAQFFPEEEIKNEARKLRKNKDLLSNDRHVLALARISGARILYTGDQDLMKDFTNKRVIDRPRGKIYSSKHFEDLLRRYPCPTPTRD